MKRAGWLAGLMLLGGCATSAPREDAAEVFGAKPKSGDSAAGQVAAGDYVVQEGIAPEKFARGYKRPLECEAAARSVKRASADRAWSYLRACVARGGFSLLTTVLDHWAEELRTRPEAPGVIADIIAARGGHVRTDLQLLQTRRLPIFDVSSALVQPATYKGRYVIFVAKVSAVKEKKGKVEVSLDEMAIGAEMMEMQVGLKSVASSSHGGQASFNTTHYGSGSVQGSSSGSYSSGQTQQSFQEAFSETGQEIVGKLTRADPFLTIDRQFVFLARFDGAKMTDVSADDEETSEEPSKVALVSLVSYHDLNAQYTW